MIALVAAVIILADQYTKRWVRGAIPVNTSYMPVAWLEPIVTLTHVENHGAAFGLFQGLGGTFAIVAVVVVAGIAWYVWRYPQLPCLAVTSFGLMAGGALGNLIDRLFRDGVVTDFVDLRWWPVFNVADSCLVIGAILLTVYTLFIEGRTKAVSENKSAADGDAVNDGSLGDGA